MMMRRYETSTPAAALGLTAVVMTALTLGVLVIMPAEMEAQARGPGMPAGSPTASLASTSSESDIATDLIQAHEAVSLSAPCTLTRPE